MSIPQMPQTTTLERAVSILVHGHAGVGKSTFAVSGTAPCLLLDVENSARFIRKPKIYWDPMTQRPPVYDGTWELCVVKIKNWDITKKAYDWLASGDHPFRSVSVDSISELQTKASEAIVGRNAMKMQDWGVLLQNMGGMLRDLRDIVGDESSPIETMSLVSTSKKYDGGILKPFLRGGIAEQVPYLFDITAYLYVDQVANAQGVLEEHRVLFTGTHPMYEAKCRPQGLPQTLYDPTLTTVLDYLFPAELAPQEAANAM